MAILFLLIERASPEATPNTPLRGRGCKHNSRANRPRASWARVSFSATIYTIPPNLSLISEALFCSADNAHLPQCPLYSLLNCRSWSMRCWIIFSICSSLGRLRTSKICISPNINCVIRLLTKKGESKTCWTRPITYIICKVYDYLRTPSCLPTLTNASTQRSNCSVV